MEWLCLVIRWDACGPTAGGDGGVGKGPPTIVRWYFMVSGWWWRSWALGGLGNSGSGGQGGGAW